MKTADTFCIYSLVLVLLFSIYDLDAQENPVFNTIQGQLATYANLTPPEKVYVQTDKDCYTSGETIWFKAYVLNGITHWESDKSRVVYVELLNSKDSIIAQRKLYANSGWAAGDITVPQDVKEGPHVLRAYTKYMLNDSELVLFQKKITIWSQQLNSNDIPEKKFEKDERGEETSKNQIALLNTTKPIVQFFPEGGNLVAGLTNVMGLKITDAAGTGIALQGKIVNEDGTQIVPFRSFEFGLASTYFEVKPDTDYYAQIEINGVTEKYPVPRPLSKGYVLQVSNYGEYVVVRVSTNINNGLKGTLLLGHLRGQLIFKRFEKNSNEDTYVIKILTSKLDDGVAHFTLFDPNGEPVSERLSFIENPKNNVNFSVKSDRPKYGFREQVALALAVQDTKGASLGGHFSMSVVTQNSLEKETSTIKSWLLLNSDIGGMVENPNYFFVDDSRARDYVLDMLMLTHGWRRFIWKSFIAEGVSKELAFQPERGIMISGSTTAFNNRYRPTKAITNLNILAGDVYQEKKPTNAQGRFSFGPFFFKDSVEAIVNAERAVKSKRAADQVSIYLDSPYPVVQVKNPLKRQIDKATSTYAKPYLKETYRKKLNDFKYDPKVTKLKEVVVKAKIKTRKELINDELSSRTLYGEARNRILLDSIPSAQTGSVLDLLRRIPGVQVFGSFPNQSVLIRGAMNFGGPIGPLYLLDGIPMSSDFIQSLPVPDVLFIDVLQSSEAALYGSRSMGGVIAIYTRTGKNFEETPERYPGIANATIPGFYKTREFYAPNYATPAPKHDKPDYRTTLDWVPDINITEKEKTKLNFYTGDTAGKYMIRIEGITSDGRPVSALHSFRVID
ncbi:TonB-dependent receptor plug domain-containing protein [Kriegella aquimaris]|uniref:MG2 domain-containing protein n=1 Tax=Kriegella aquimaris TaxID=192904 RepID=A0A1G9KBC6_9FLAO|nr:TonB-dependent receptor plug domain-containing protein [Kriegella aquimaris]SDL47088.1 MG2 domain-containing protein [Kriegella aquimaris]